MAHVLLDCGGSQEGVETVQLREQFVMPGFNDAHVHLGGAAADLLAVPLTGVPSAEKCRSVSLTPWLSIKRASGSPAPAGTTPFG